MLGRITRSRLGAYPLLFLAAAAFSSVAVAGGFGLWVEAPAAGTAASHKGAVLLVHTEDCRGPSARPSVSARAEGLVRGRRRSVPLRLRPVAAADASGFTVYAIKRRWPAEGVWLLTFTGKSPGKAPSGSRSIETCRVMVELGPNGSVPKKNLPVRYVTGRAREIETTLWTLARRQAAGTAVSRSSR